MGRRTRTRLGPSFSEACRLAWLRLGELKWNPNVLRKHLLTQEGRELASGLVNGWLYGDRVPSLFYVLQIETLLGVPAEAWQKKSTAPFTLSEAA